MSSVHPSSHQAPHFPHIDISAWSRRAFEFVIPSQKGVPSGTFLKTEKRGAALLFQEVEISSKVRGEADEVFFRWNMTLL